MHADRNTFTMSYLEKERKTFLDGEKPLQPRGNFIFASSYEIIYYYYALNR